MSDQVIRLHLNQGYQRRVIVPVMLGFILLVIATALGSGCPGGEPAVNLEGKCQKVGDRCRLRVGVLGVCSPTAGGASAKSTLVCTPQH